MSQCQSCDVRKGFNTMCPQCRINNTTSPYNMRSSTSTSIDSYSYNFAPPVVPGLASNFSAQTASVPPVVPKSQPSAPPMAPFVPSVAPVMPVVPVVPVVPTGVHLPPPVVPTPQSSVSLPTVPVPPPFNPAVPNTNNIPVATPIYGLNNTYSAINPQNVPSSDTNPPPTVPYVYNPPYAPNTNKPTNSAVNPQYMTNNQPPTVPYVHNPPYVPSTNKPTNSAVNPQYTTNNFNSNVNSNSNYTGANQQPTGEKMQDGIKFGYYTGAKNNRNQRHGYGTMKYDDGSMYEGIWNKNKKGDGMGTLLYASGPRYVGSWRKDEMCGSGTYYYPDGRIDLRHYNKYGEVSGEGVQYSSDRQSASLLKSGRVKKHISLTAASKIATKLGLPVPR